MRSNFWKQKPESQQNLKSYSLNLSGAARPLISAYYLYFVHTPLLCYYLEKI